MQQPLAARGQVERQPRLAQPDRIHVDHVEIGDVARRDHAAIVEPIEPRSIVALAFHRVLQRNPASALAVAHPMLEHERGAGGIADRAAMRTAVGQRIDRVVAQLQRFEEIEIAVGIVEDRQIDHSGAIIGHEQVVGVFGRAHAFGGGAGGDAGIGGGFVIEIGVHFELVSPHFADHAQQVDDIAFGIDVGFGQHCRAEGRVLELGQLLVPRQFGNCHERRAEAERVDGAAPAHDDAVAAQGDLRDDVGAGGIFAAHLGNLLVERQFLGDRLQRRERHRQPGFAAQRAHPAEFVPFALHVAGHFEHAVAHAAHRAADADQFVRGGGGAWHHFAIDRLVDHRAAG